MNKPKQKIDANRWVDEYAQQLFRFAYLRTKNDALSEDLVQDTFFSALKAADKFEGKSSEKTWLYSILRNKIIDHYRKASTKREEYKLDNPELNEDAIQNDSSGLFKGNGHWKDKGFLADASKASYLVESKDFYKSLNDCLSELPFNTQMAFRLKHLQDLDTDEICKELNVTASNYWVLLHRARLALRNCLVKKEISYDD